MPKSVRAAQAGAGASAPASKKPGAIPSALLAISGTLARTTDAVTNRGAVKCPQTRTKPGNRFTTPQRRAFLNALAGNPNITAACKVAKVHSILVYAERLKSPEFCREWADALATGYARLEAHGLEKTLRLASGKMEEDERAQFEKDQKLINNQLGVHRATVRGEAAKSNVGLKTDVKAANQRVVAQLRLMRARHVASNDPA